VSETLVIDETWPATLPLPVVDFSGTPRNTTMVSPMENGNILRRSRYLKSYTSIDISLVLDPDEYAAFQTFFETTTDLGCALFKVELRYPQNTALTEWACRFLGGYEASYQEGLWSVTAAFDLINETVLDDGSPLVGWTQFYVADGFDSDPGDDQAFETNDGYNFYVQE
jgi:hypothetical protein